MTVPADRISAWEMQRLMVEHFGHRAITECLYSWFSEAKCTCSYENTGWFLLLDCTEPQAVEVLHHIFKALEKKKRPRWDKFVLERDWPVHSTRNHPPERIKEIWRRVDPENPGLKRKVAPSPRKLGERGLAVECL